MLSFAPLKWQIIALNYAFLWAGHPKLKCLIFFLLLLFLPNSRLKPDLPVQQKILQDRKRLPRVYIIGCRGVKLSYQKTCLMFCQKLGIIRNFNFKFCVTIWIDFFHSLSFWVLSHFEFLSLVAIGFFEFCCYFSFVPIWVFEFCHNLRFLV